jgi:hypothetical protein
MTWARIAKFDAAHPTASELTWYPGPDCAA